MLLCSLRALRSAQQRVQGSCAMATAWRGLADESASGAAASGSSGGSHASQQPAAEPPPAAAEAPSLTGSAERVVSIDRSGLFNPQPHSHDPAQLAAAAAAAGVEKEPETDLVRHLKALIQFRGGPLTLAEFMSEALTNPQHGYYSQRDVFGVAGDFITSPEISQMFGELVGIWCVATWQQLGCPPRLHIVELGPGRGTLMADLLRGTSAFRDFSQALRLSMVEVSPHLRGVQWRTLRCQGPPPDTQPAAAPGAQQQEQQGQHSGSGGADSHAGSAATDPAGDSNSGGGGAAAAATGDLRPDPGPLAGASGWGGVPVSWHRSLDEVQPAGPALYIAHEFLDALPVHQFQRTERGWCERLVDVASPDSPLHLRLVLSPGPTPAAHVLLPRRLRQLPQPERGEVAALEVCPQGMALAESLAQRVAQHGGAALIVDYGQDAPYEASLQAIRRHQFVGLLEQPGCADLSNRVDYSALRSSVDDSGAAAEALGPIPQSTFLLGLGIEARLQALLEQASPEEAEALQAGFRRLVGGTEPGAGLTEEGMGASYQAFCIAQRGLQPWPFGAVVQEGSDGEEEPPQEQQQEQQQRAGSEAAGQESAAAACPESGPVDGRPQHVEQQAQQHEAERQQPRQP